MKHVAGNFFFIKQGEEKREEKKGRYGGLERRRVQSRNGARGGEVRRPEDRSIFVCLFYF